jgi:hypothetical protein
VPIKIAIRPLEYYRNSNTYLSFYHNEHHNTIERKKLRNVLKNAYKLSMRTGVEVNIFGYDIAEVISGDHFIHKNIFTDE